MKLLSLRVREEVIVQRFQGFYFYIFLVWKPSGKLWMINNLIYNNFCTENIYSARNQIFWKAFMVTLDLQLHVPIHDWLHKFLQSAIQMGQGLQSWQLLALPFGLMATSRFFTKILTEVMAFFSASGNIRNSLFRQCLDFFHRTVWDWLKTFTWSFRLFPKLGCRINQD